MNETNHGINNLLWLGAYKSANFTNKGIPCVPLISMSAEDRQVHEKTFQTNIRILERKTTSNQALKIVAEFIELGGDYPPKHNLATMESYFPTPEEFPHQVGDTFRAEVTRKYLKADMDTNRENVLGLKTGEYDNHYIYKVNWGSWQFVEGQPHSTIGDFEPQQNELKVVEPTPSDTSFKEKDAQNNEPKPTTSQELNKPQIVKVQDERQMDRDARNQNSSDSIAGNMIVELWSAGRFPQMLNYTDIVHIGEQVKVLSKIIQGNDSETVKNEYNEFLQKVMGMEDWLEHGWAKANKK
tara:strand:+ start:1699 stop:2589 length:891 start_codon:yes stop_codon:yes gene_type:complete